MDLILHWLQSNQVIAWIASCVVGITAVSAAVRKYSPAIRRYVKISREGLDLIDTMLDALQDDKITDEEVRKIVEEANHFKDALK